MPKGKDLSRHQAVSADVGLHRSFTVVVHLPIGAPLDVSEQCACELLENWMLREIQAGRKPITGTLGISTTRAVTLDAVSHSAGARIPIIEFTGEVAVRDPNEVATYDAAAFRRLSRIFFLLSTPFQNLGGGITLGDFEWEAYRKAERYVLRELWHESDLNGAVQPAAVSN